MVRAGSFEKLLELSESLTLDEKETFLEVLHQRSSARATKAARA